MALFDSNIGVFMKSTILFLVVFFVSCLIVMPAISSASSTPTLRPDRGLFHLQFIIYLSWLGNATSTPINPGETRQIPMNVSSTVTRGAFGKLLLFLLADRQFVIQAEVQNVSSWATAGLVANTLNSVIPSQAGVFSTIPDTLSIFVKIGTPPYQTGFVILHLWADDYQGPLGLWTLIGGYDATFTLSFVSGQ